MSSYQIDPEPSKDERFTDELSALAERNTSLRVLIDETNLGAGFIGPADIRRIIAAWRRATALGSTRIAVFVPISLSMASTACSRVLADATPRHVSVFTARAAATAWLLEH